MIKDQKGTCKEEAARYLNVYVFISGQLHTNQGSGDETHGLLLPLRLHAAIEKQHAAIE
jgi:hypothetical protein